MKLLIPPADSLKLFETDHTEFRKCSVLDSWMDTSCLACKMMFMRQALSDWVIRPNSYKTDMIWEKRCCTPLRCPLPISHQQSVADNRLLMYMSDGTDHFLKPMYDPFIVAMLWRRVPTCNRPWKIEVSCSPPGPGFKIEICYSWPRYSPYLMACEKSRWLTLSLTHTLQSPFLAKLIRQLR